MSQQQERYLLSKHLTGSFPGGVNGYKTIMRLIGDGYCETDDAGKTIRVTAKGKDYCDVNHLRIKL